MIENFLEVYNSNTVLFWALVIPLWIVVCIIYYSRRAKRQLKWQKQADLIATFHDKKAILSFVAKRGIEGIETFKPNYRTRIELQDDEIRFTECDNGAYANNLNSASLQYSQITNVAVVEMSENYLGRTNFNVPSSETIQTGRYLYCLITYLNKDGEEKNLRFLRYSFGGNFDTFLKALQSRIAPPTPTDINL